MKTKPENDISFALQMLQEAIDKVNSPADRKPLRQRRQRRLCCRAPGGIHWRQVGRARERLRCRL